MKLPLFPRNPRPPAPGPARAGRPERPPAGDLAQAAHGFERAGAWLAAARSYQAQGKPAEALRVLDEGERALERGGGGRQRTASEVEELRLLRAALLLQLGRDGAAAALLRSLPPSGRGAELLEQAGCTPEAVRCYLAIGETEKAHRLAARVPDRDRLLAEIYLQSGRPVEAGHLFARLGLAREAAEAYEAGQEWGYAAYRWEAVGELKRAAQAYEKAGRQGHAARCYAAAGMTRLAVDAFVQAGEVGAAVDLRVRAGQLLEAASLYLAKGDRPRAAQVLLRLQPGDPGFGAGTVLLAPLLIAEGFAADALDRLRRIPPDCFALDEETLPLELSYWEGRALEALGREAEARERYAEVTDLDPGHRDARERLGRLRGPAAPPATLAASPAAERQDVLAVGGRVAGRYDILAELGRGGMGRVYQAHDLELDETVAIKALLGAGEGGFGEETRLLQEIQICRRISHPNVVRVFDLGRFSGGLFLTMEYLEGRRLDQLIAAEAPLRFGRIRGLLAEIAAGLREAHALGIVHRDLKPSNLMITPTRLKILDFGIAAMAGVQGRRTQAGCVMGSPMYMSPEQVLGRPLDGRSDLYSLGLLTYTLIAGREPYQGVEPTALVLKQLHEPPPDLRAIRPDTSERWLALVGKLCAKDPEKRFQSAQEVLDALDELPVE